MGLDVYLCTAAENRDESLSKDVPALADPEHICNRRYLRSSYNDGGFNRVAEQAGAHGFYEIFAPVRQGDDYETELTAASLDALRECRVIADQSIAAMEAWDGLKAAEVGAPMLGEVEHMWSKHPTKGQVLDWARAELARPAGAFGDSWYSSAKGDVMPGGAEVLAITLGTAEFGFRSELTPIIVFRLDGEARKHYADSARIAGEFIDEAISLIEADGSCFMHWSA